MPVGGFMPALQDCDTYRSVHISAKFSSEKS